MLITHTEQHQDSDAKLPETAFATRTTTSRSTIFSPSFLNLGWGLPLFGRMHSLCASKAVAPAFFEFTVNLRKGVTEAVKSARESHEAAAGCPT